MKSSQIVEKVAQSSSQSSLYLNVRLHYDENPTFSR